VVVEPLNVHELTAAYALDALDPEDVAAYEAHLARCQSCRDELASFGETATALAWAVDAPAPPARLRAAILDAAAEERANVVPLLRRSWAFRATAAVAAVAACAAVGFAIWSASLHSRLGSHRTVSAAVVVDAAGRATLTVSGLPAAPSGKTYEAWVIPVGGAPRRAGLFRGGRRTVVHLARPVPAGAVVAATVERDGGTDAPTTTPVLTAQA
jgi:anti-sigma-K factor RskA